MIDKRLLEFGIVRETDVIASTTDGASMMKKFGRLLGCYHQLCIAHALHLAVTDVLYQKPASISSERRGGENAEDLEEEEEGEEEEEEEEEGDSQSFAQEEARPDVPPFCESLADLIRQVRIIIKTFRKSPVKNDFLAKCCEELGLEFTKLLLDVKTRWNSVVKMVRSLLRILSAVNKALLEFGLAHLILSEAEVNMLRGVVDCLDTIEVAATELGGNDVDMGAADKIMEFILVNLGKDESPFGTSMYDAVFRRIEERRMPHISGLIRYLSGENLSDSTLSYPSRQELMKTARDVFVKFFWEKPASCEAEAPTPTTPPTAPTASTSQGESDDPPCKRSKSAELKAFLCEKASTSCNSSYRCSSDVIAEIKRQFTSFDASGKLPPDLENILLALKSIPPTSVEAERAFSAAGLFMTKLRTRMDDQCIDMLCFLRHYFMRK